MESSRGGKALAVLIDTIIILLVVALGIALRFPMHSSTYSNEMTIEYTDGDELFLSDPDSYLYARKARQFAENLSGFTMINERSQDGLQNAVSTKEDGLIANGLPFIAAVIYRLLHTFTRISIDTIVYYLSTVLCALVAIPAYIYVRRMTNRLGGTVAAILSVCIIPFLEHTRSGYFDTDALLCVLPVASITALALMVYEDKIIRKVVWAIVSVMMFLTIACCWEAFYVYYGIIVFLSVCVLILMLVMSKFFPMGNVKPIRELAFLGTTLIAMLVGVFAIYGTTFIGSMRRLFTNMLSTNNYPDTTKYITELADIPVLGGGLAGAFTTSGDGIINRLGGIVAIIVTVLSLALLIILLVLRIRGSSVGKKISTRALCSSVGVIGAWLIITAPLCISGVRFLQIVCLPSVLLMGLGIGALCDILDKNIRYYIFLPILVLVTLIGPIWGAISRSYSAAPFYTSTYKKACYNINTTGADNASILTWWDYGYYIQYAAARHVLADGGTFDARYFLYLGRALMTDDPKLSVAIFNMLDIRGVDAVEIAEDIIGDDEQAANMLLNILPLDTEVARQLLIDKYELQDEDATRLLEAAKPVDNNERYLIISRDLIDKIEALTYYGLYDFTDSDVSPRLAVSTSSIMPTSDNQEVALRGLKDVTIVARQESAGLNVSLVGQNGIPVGISRCIYVENGNKLRDDIVSDSGYTIYVINDEDHYSFIVCSDDIADSMLVSLMAVKSNGIYTRVDESVLDKRFSGEDSVTARFFGSDNDSNLSSAGVLVYRAVN